MELTGAADAARRTETRMHEEQEGQKATEAASGLNDRLGPATTCGGNYAALTGSPYAALIEPNPDSLLRLQYRECIADLVDYFSHYRKCLSDDNCPLCMAKRLLDA
jgi:hypothetical protein